MPRKPQVRNFNAALWTVPMCCEWSGLKHKMMLRLIAARELKVIAVGPEQESGGKPRRCAKYLVPKKSFQAFIARLASRGRMPTGKEAA